MSQIKGDIIINNVADLIDYNDPQKRTFREVNAARVHLFNVGELVELATGERLFIKKLTRDCDQTPLYSLGRLNDDDNQHPLFNKWHHGIAEENLKLVW